MRWSDNKRWISNTTKISRLYVGYILFLSLWIKSNVSGRKSKKKKKTHPTENNICEAVSLVTSSTLIRTEDYEKMLLVASFCVASAILPYKWETSNYDGSSLQTPIWCKSVKCINSNTSNTYHQRISEINFSSCTKFWYIKL